MIRGWTFPKPQWHPLPTMLLVALLCVLGCNGLIENGTPTGGPGDPNDPAGPGGGGVGEGADGIEARVWRLSPAQFDGEVQRLLGEGAPPANLPASASEFGLTNIAANARIDVGNAGIFAEAARSIGRWAASQGGAVSRCEDHGTDACVDRFLAWFVEGAFRRPVDPAELAELRGLFDELRAAYDYDYAFAGVVRAVLLSPSFLYRTELGEGEGPHVELSPFEIANLMSFAITDRGPDAPLLEAASGGELRDPAVRAREARRLMASSDRVWKRFFWEWLHMSTLRSQAQEVGLDAQLVEQMEEEYAHFVKDVIVEKRGTLRDLLTATYTFARPELATHYGAEHPGDGLTQITLDPTQRGGLFTQGAWLVSHGKRGRDNVVRRGMNVFVSAMCHNIAVPPDLDVEAELAKLVSPDATVREVVEVRGTAPTCGACHRTADPVGLVFESYASDARWQTTYPSDGRPVETRIELADLGTFDRASEFSAALADDLRFQYCFVRRFAHSLLGIDVGSPAVVAWMKQAHDAFVASGTSFEELLVAIVTDPAFIERTTGGGE